MRSIIVFFILCSALLLTGCMGESDTDTLDPASSGSSSQPVGQAEKQQIEITVGTPAARVGQLLGTADNISNDSKGREVWTYEGKRAKFAYASNAKNVQALVIGGYATSAAAAPNLPPLTMRITFDSGRKVIDFAFNQMGF